VLHQGKTSGPSSWHAQANKHTGRFFNAPIPRVFYDQLYVWGLLLFVSHTLILTLLWKYCASRTLPLCSGWSLISLTHSVDPHGVQPGRTLLPGLSSDHHHHFYPGQTLCLFKANGDQNETQVLNSFAERDVCDVKILPSLGHLHKNASSCQLEFHSVAWKGPAARRRLRWVNLRE